MKTGNVDLVIYDKRGEVVSKKSEAYQHAMRQRRWGGRLPDAATRIEYQLRRQYFNELGLNTVCDVEASLPEIVARTTRLNDHPFFVLTDRVPDRKGRPRIGRVCSRHGDRQSNACENERGSRRISSVDWIAA